MRAARARREPRGSAAPPAPDVVVIGVGNEDRRDDGVGSLVVRRLRRAAPAGARWALCAGDAPSLLEAWRGAREAILVDALVSGATPGSVHRFEAHLGPVPAEFAHCSSHSLGVAEAIEMGRALGALPERLVVFGIEGEDFRSGRGLSRGVEAAARAVVREILVSLRARARGRAPGRASVEPVHA